MHPIKSHVMLICHIACDTNFDHLVKVVSAIFPHCKLTVFPLLSVSVLQGSYFLSFIDHSCLSQRL